MNLASLGLDPSPLQTSQLAEYAKLLRAWNKKINLISPSTVEDLETRHILDSAQLVPHLPLTPCNIADIGAGAGLPGLILAILTPHQVTLVERDQRKAAFLATAVHQLGLKNAKVAAQDVAQITEKFNVVTCRAWASLSDILTLTSPLLAPGGEWIVLKGEAVEDEIKAVSNAFQVTFSRTPSITNPKACVLRATPVPRETNTI